MDSEDQRAGRPAAVSQREAARNGGDTGPRLALAVTLVFALLAAGALGVAWLAGGGAAREGIGKAGVNGEIAFVRSRGRVADIVALDTGSQQIRPMTSGSGNASTPSWSSDGRRLAYAWRDPRQGGYQLRVMSADGAADAALTDPVAIDGSPSWSPAGDRIVFSSNRDAPGFGVYVIRLDGSTPVRLADGTAPAWSPNGDRIAFVGLVEGAPDILTMRPDGTDVRNVTRHAADDVDPAWAPDGRSLVFASDRAGGFDLYRIELGRDTATRLTSGPDDDRGPAVSPDGRLVVFSRTTQGSANLWWIEEGTVRRLTADALFDADPSWRPLTR